MGRFTTVFVIGGVLLGAPLFLKGTTRPLLAAGGGTISGKVVLVGEAPQAKKIEITKDREKCGSEKMSEDLVVSPDRGIKNAVVTLNGVKANAAGGTTPALDQKGCGFNPRVLIAAPGKPVDILNNDGILHNVHTYSSKNPPINKAQPAFKKKMTESFGQAEIIKVTCDAHSWMLGWIVVTDQPAAATDGAGSFKLTDVPAGNHTLEIWHETLGKVTKQVSVKAGEETKVTIELSKK